ncbi:dihydrofolate reductase family protein [Rhodococcus sp. B50]|uniref:dihydrofolate reductase family protein n=1 Tax=Rhodococcus sp. B50 TaxID=2682847 RepID=UPI001A0730F1|nr:dihydrofolate reductase family protein [Rhodococcus sp. B50]
MGRILVHEFVSLDGGYEDPSFTADYGFPDDLGASVGRLTDSSKAILLGRNTFHMFAAGWADRTAEDDPGAPFFNETPKYVVSSTLDNGDEWKNSTVLGPYDPGAIRDLKAATDGDIYVSGSGTLVRALLADGLVDELHLLMYPVVLGSGARLFPDGVGRLPLTLLGSESFGNGVVHLTYGPAA